MKDLQNGLKDFNLEGGDYNLIKYNSFYFNDIYSLVTSSINLDNSIKYNNILELQPSECQGLTTDCWRSPQTGVVDHRAGLGVNVVSMASPSEVICILASSTGTVKH